MIGSSARPQTGRSPAARSPFFTVSLAGIFLIVVFQAIWFAWSLLVLLPNAHNAGVDIWRGWLLLKAFPGVVPGTSFRDSLLGLAVEKLGHFENLPQRLPILGAAGLIASAAVALGAMILRALRLDRQLGVFERLAASFGLGCAVLGAITLILGRWGFLGPWVVRIGLAIPILFGLVILRPWNRLEPLEAGSGRGIHWGLLLVMAPFVGVMLLGSMLPSTDFDVVEYHLQGPKEYFQAGRISFLPHNVYTSMPFGVEMLHLLGMELLNDWWWGALVGQLLVACFAPAAAILVAATARRVASDRAAWISALLYLSTPWIYRLAVIAYVEGPLCYFHAALVWAFVVFRLDLDRPLGRTWTLLGLFAGGAMACKYPGLISAVIPFGLLSVLDSWKHRSTRPVLAFSLGWALLMAPWLVRNLFDTGNPVYPLAYSLFGGRNWDEALDRKWSAGHGRRPISYEALIESVKDVAGRSDWQSPLYAALAPLALLRRGSRRIVLTLWGYVIYLFATWWLLTHRIDRFWLPLLPTLAVLAGAGADWTRRRIWTIWLAGFLALGILGNFVYISTALAGLNEWTGDLVFLRKDLAARINRPLTTIDEQLPPKAKILLVGQAAVFHVKHPIVYNVVFNHETLELMASGRTAEEFAEALRERGISHIYVDWQEVHRHRKPGGYGFTDFVTPQRFAEWTRDGILIGPQYVGPAHELYEVVSRPSE